MASEKITLYNNQRNYFAGGSGYIDLKNTYNLYDPVSGESRTSYTLTINWGGQTNTISVNNWTDMGKVISLLPQVTFTWMGGDAIALWIWGYITYPDCVPNWQCEPGQTGYEVDGCSNRRANPACAYREASLVSCMWPQNPIAGQAYQIGITVNQGSRTEDYKLVFSGGYVGESAPFTVNEGTGQQQFTAGNLIFTTGGAKNITASLVKA